MTRWLGFARGAVLAVVLLVLGARPACADLAQRLSSGMLRWGGDAEGGAPFQLRDPQDPARVVGFEVEMADALAEVLSRRLGRSLRAEFVQYDWVSLLPGLERGDFDVVIAGLEITPERRQKILFSRPYYIYQQQLVVRRDNQQIQSLDDCRTLALGTLAGSAAERVLEDFGCTNVEAFDGQVEPYLDLELGRIDAVLLDTPIVTYYGLTNPNLKQVGMPLGRGEYGIGLRADDRELATALDEALGELMRTGQLRDIYRRWHLWNVDQQELAQGPQQAAEQQGLGFDGQGQAVDDSQLPAVERVDRNLIAAAASQWTFDRYAPLLVKAAGMTILLSVLSMAAAVTGGLLVTLCRLYAPAPLQLAALGYVEFFRGVPQLLVLFFLYFGLTHYGVQMPAVMTAICSFGLTYAAYESEVYRSAIQSVSPGQWEAARALGMHDVDAFRRIIFPQALRTALGPMTNDFVALFKDTSLVSVIAVRELTKEYLILSRSSLKFVELGLLTAALYLAMSLPLGYLSRWLERRWGPGR
jgi:polar amino acid transport system substrate-binding protein